MKKIKLLAPLLGAIATASSALPLVACQKPTEVVPTVSVVNRNEDTKYFIDIKCDKDKVEDLTQDLTLDITWNGSPESKYYSEAISVTIGNKVYFVKTAKDQKGYIFNSYAKDGNGINITIPSELLTKDDIIVNLYLKVAAYDLFEIADAYIPNGVRIEADYYDVVSTYKEGDEGHPWFDVLAGERVEFAIDLNEYFAGRASQGEPKLDGDLYFIITHFDAWVGDNIIIELSSLTLDEVYWGQQKLHVENDDGIICVHEPQDGWGDSQTKLPPITGWYMFQNSYNDVKISAGQKHFEKN